MPLALPLDGMPPLLLHVMLDPFQLRDTPIERKVLVESFEHRCQVPLRIASAPVSMPSQPFVRVI
jgi:hypothetical protein